MLLPDAFYFAPNFLYLLRGEFYALNLAIFIKTDHNRSIEVVESTTQVLAQLFLCLLRQDDVGSDHEHLLIGLLLEMPHLERPQHRLAHRGRRHQFVLTGEFRHDLVGAAVYDLVHVHIPGVLLVVGSPSCEAERQPGHQVLVQPDLLLPDFLQPDGGHDWLVDFLQNQFGYIDLSRVRQTGTHTDCSH